MYRNNSSYSRRPQNRWSNNHRHTPPIVGGCMFCQEDLEESLWQHTRKQCPTFKNLKRNTSAQPYIRSSLKDNEMTGFAAAGVLLWRRCMNDDGNNQMIAGKNDDIEVLMAREYRALTQNGDCNGDRLNFLGGKRLRRSSTALECAVDKMNEETGYQFSPVTIALMRDGCPLVSWSSNSKYVLFIFELVRDDDRDIDIRCAGINGTGIKRLEWTPIKKLVKSTHFVRNEMHKFAGEMLQDLITSNILTHLEELFDVAYAPTPNADEESKAKEDAVSMSDFLSHYDLESALRAMLKAVRPDDTTLTANKTPSFSNLCQAVNIIPKIDMRKLLLRLHPDRLFRVLHRQPDTNENMVATMAMQALNGLMSADHAESNEKDVMTNLKNMEKLRSEEMHRCTEKGTDVGNVAALDKMLSKLSLRKDSKSKRV